MDIENIKTKAQLIRNESLNNMETLLLEFESYLHKNSIDTYWIHDENQLAEQIIQLSTQMNNYAKIWIDNRFPNLFDKLKLCKSGIKQTSIEDLEENRDLPEFSIVYGDFGIAENGNVFLLDSPLKQGFNNLTALIIVLEINNIVPKQSDLDVLLYLKYGENFASDIKIISTPLKTIEQDYFSASANQLKTKDVPVFVFLYDNGISNILNKPKLRQILHCINCKSCGKVCPVFQINGAYSPKELIINFMIPDQVRTKNIFNYTTLCGNCETRCPVQIPLKDLLIEEMSMTAKQSFNAKSSNLFKLFSKRSKMNKLNKRLRRLLWIRRYYGKNKKLYNYFVNQREPFFNISQREENE